MSISHSKKAAVIYPESDEQPMADNTIQFRWIVTLQGGLDAIFKGDPQVFGAGNLFWYPVEGHPEIVTAPDAMVIFGRPKGDRGIYAQWEEGNIPPQIVFEVLSPSNSLPEMNRKRDFYEQYGVEEYYLYDPYKHRLQGWQRQGERLERIIDLEGWVSPRLGVRFEPGESAEEDWRVYGPDGRPLATYLELFEQREVAERIADRERTRREVAERLAEAERMQRALAEQRAQAEQAQRELAEQRAQAEQAQRALAEQRAQTEQMQRELAEQRAQAEQAQREAAEQRAQVEQVQRELAEQRAQAEQAQREAAEQRAQAEQAQRTLAEQRAQAEQAQRELAEQQARQAEQQTEAERLQRQQAEQQAEAERLRAERLTARLKELGLSADD